jgi:hypothetical protein
MTGVDPYDLPEIVGELLEDLPIDHEDRVA